ncbi:MAG: hypothetical protein KGL39_23950 [Patescibacteria group bacterium]|nr:hypothetical protein [Patescibacteria group bacterium]
MAARIIAESVFAAQEIAWEKRDNKDSLCWQCMQLSNTNAEYAIDSSGYKYAIRWYCEPCRRFMMQEKCTNPNCANDAWVDSLGAINAKTLCRTCDPSYIPILPHDAPDGAAYTFTHHCDLICDTCITLGNLVRQNGKLASLICADCAARIKEAKRECGHERWVSRLGVISNMCPVCDADAIVSPSDLPPETHKLFADGVMCENSKAVTQTAETVNPVCDTHANAIAFVETKETKKASATSGLIWKQITHYWDHICTFCRNGENVEYEDGEVVQVFCINCFTALKERPENKCAECNKLRFINTFGVAEGDVCKKCDKGVLPEPPRAPLKPVTNKFTDNPAVQVKKQLTKSQKRQLQKVRHVARKN